MRDWKTNQLPAWCVHYNQTYRQHASTSRNFKVLVQAHGEYQNLSQSCCEHNVNIKKFQSPAANHLWISRIFKKFQSPAAKHLWISRIFKVLRRTICEYQKISKWCCEYSANFDFSCEYALNYSQQDLVCVNIHIMFATISCEPICSQDIRSIFATSSLVVKGWSNIDLKAWFYSRKYPKFIWYWSIWMFQWWHMSFHTQEKCNLLRWGDHQNTSLQ